MSEIKPALTPEEWAAEFAWRDERGDLLRLEDFRSFNPHSDAGSWGMEGRCPRCQTKVRMAEHAWWEPVCECPMLWNDDGTANLSTSRHGVGAIALYGQPYGFTWDDVDLLREIAHGNEMDERDGLMTVADRPFHSGLRNLADRLAALLPPRDPR